MGAFQDLEKLLYEGYLEKEVEIRGLKLTLRTLTVAEERKVLENAGITDIPENTAENMSYIPALLHMAIVKIDNEVIDTVELKRKLSVLLNSAYNAGFLKEVYEAWQGLVDKRVEANADLKNS